MFQTNPSKTMTDLAKYSVGRYVELELDGRPCGYQVGGIEVAETQERWDDLERKHGLATSWGLESELISPQECAERVPVLDPTGSGAASTFPQTASPKLSGPARRWPGWPGRGAKFYGETEVTGIEVKDGREIRRDGQGPRRDRARRELRGDVGAQDRADGRHEGAARADAAPVRVDHAAGGACRGDARGRSSYPAPPGLLDVLPPEGDRYGIGTYRHRPMPVSADDIGRDYRGEGEFPSVWEFTPEDFESSWQEARKMLPPWRGRR